MTIEELARQLLERSPPASLRELDSDMLREFLSQGGHESTVLTGLKRFVRLLRDTDQLDFDQAGEALDVLAGRG